MEYFGKTFLKSPSAGGSSPPLMFDLGDPKLCFFKPIMTKLNFLGPSATPVTYSIPILYDAGVYI